MQASRQSWLTSQLLGDKFVKANGRLHDLQSRPCCVNCTGQQAKLLRLTTMHAQLCNISIFVDSIQQLTRCMQMYVGKQAKIADLTALNDKFVKANGRLHDLQNQQRDLETKLAHDYGLEEAFGALVDKCYDTQVSHPCMGQSLMSC